MRKGKSIGSKIRLVIATMVALTMLLSGFAASFTEVLKVNAQASVDSWQSLRGAINGGETEIELGGDFAYDGTSIEIPAGKTVTIKGSGTIYSTATPAGGKYEPMFKVTGGSLTVDTGVTLSAKTSLDSAGCPTDSTYTADKFTGDVSADGKTYSPKGFFIQVQSNGTATLAGTISDFVTSRKKATTPRYVAPVVADGTNAKFDITADGVIKNNVVGYIVDDTKASNDAQTIKQYVKGAGQNVPRIPNANIQKRNVENFGGRPRNRDAGIDDGVPGSGITGTAGAVIYKDGASGEICGLITNNRADTGGIMVSGESAEVVINTGTIISKNVGVQFGGGSTVEQGGTIRMEDGKMTENVAWFGGGAVYATENGIDWLLGRMSGDNALSPAFDERKDGDFQMYGGSLEYNTALTRGGAILVDSDAVHIMEGELKNNMSRMLGGAVYVMGDHPLYTYTMNLTGLYVHDNTAVSGVVPGDKAEENKLLQTKLIAPSLNCSDIPPAILSGTDDLISVNTDDMNDGPGTHGTGGGLWLCAYGNTVFSAGSTDKVVIANNYATGTAPLSNPVYSNYIRNGSDENAKKIRADIAYNSASSTATTRTTGKTGGNDIHADTGDSGTVVIADLNLYNGWIDENASTGGTDVPYTTEISDGRINLINNGNKTTLNNPKVEISGNIARRGGGLAADGTFLLGPVEDQVTVESAITVDKEWVASVDRKPITIVVKAKTSSGNEAVVAEVPLDGIANAPVSEFDNIEELAPAGTIWRGKFKLPLELAGSNGKIKVFTLTATYQSTSGTFEYNNQIIDPTSLTGRRDLAKLIKAIRIDNTNGGVVDSNGFISDLKNAITVSFNNDLSFECVEYETDENGNPVVSDAFVFTSDQVNLNTAEFSITSTSYYEEVFDENTQQYVEREAYQVHLFGIDLNLKSANDNWPLTEKYVNKDVHSDIVNFDQDFVYDIMAYVPMSATEFTISDKLVKGLEFVDEEGNGDPFKIVKSIVMKDSNNHEVGAGGTVSSDAVLRTQNGNAIDFIQWAKNPAWSAYIPEITINGNELTVKFDSKVMHPDVFGKWVRGRWVQITFNARIKDEYRTLEGLKALQAEVSGKDKSWEETGTNKQAPDAKDLTFYNGDLDLVKYIVDNYGEDPIEWAVEAPSRLFARSRNGVYYATPMDDKSGNTWELLVENSADWNNANNRYNGLPPHANNTVRSISTDDPKITPLKSHPVVIGHKLIKGAEGGTRLFVQTEDANGQTHYFATPNNDKSGAVWEELTDPNSDAYKNAIQRLKPDNATIRMLDLTSTTTTLDDEGKNWPVISEEEHEGMANQAIYNVKFGNNAEGSYKTNTVTVKPDTTSLKVQKVWNIAGSDEWPEDVTSVTVGVFASKDGVETPVYVKDGKVVGADVDGSEELTVELTKDKTEETIEDLPRLKKTIYVAKELKIDDKDVSENGVTNISNDATKENNIITSGEVSLDGDGAKLEKLLNDKDVYPLCGAVADNRLWAMSIDGDYYYTEEGDVTGTSEDTVWTLIEKPEGDNVNADYDRAKALLGTTGSKPTNNDADDTFFYVDYVYKALNVKPSIEKYVNDDVHAELVAFDKAFKYDVMVYVPAGSTELTITDPLVEALEFAKEPTDVDNVAAEKATAPSETIVSVVAKDKNDHTANSTVAGNDEDNAGVEIESDKYTAEFVSTPSKNTLKVSFKGEEDTEKTDPQNPDKKFYKPLDFAGKWVQVTFWAKYTDAVIEAVDAGDFEKVRDNGAVISEEYPSVAKNAADSAFAHEGTVNKASADIKVGNDANFEIDTNKVTVKPEDTKLYVEKKWLDESGNEKSWPTGLSVKVNVLKNEAGKDAEVVQTITIDSEGKKVSNTLPKLVGVTYTVDETEVEVPERYEQYGSVTGTGTEDDPYVFTNKAIQYAEVEATKIWKGVVTNDIPSAEDFKSMLVLKDPEGNDVTEKWAANLTVTPKGNTYIAKWVDLLPYGEYTVEEKDVPGYDKEQNGLTITNTKKPSEEKPEIEKYVNQAVHKDIQLTEEFTYDIIAYVTKDADSVIVTDELNEVLTFASSEEDVKVVDLGEEVNHKVTNNIDNMLVNEGASVAEEGTPIEAAEVEMEGRTLKVSIFNKLKPIYAEDETPTVSDDPSDDTTSDGVDAPTTDTDGGDATDTTGDDTTTTPDDAGDTTGNTDGDASQTEKEIIGYEYDGEVQPVTALRGHWIKITFKAKIDGKTLEEVKEAYKQITADQVESDRAEENVGNAPVLSVEDHLGIPNDASYTIGVANEAGIEEDVHKDRSNTVTVKPDEKPEEPEIEKYVNKAVHEYIDIEDTFTYDVIAYVTNTADKVVIKDELNEQLDFVSEAGDITVVDLGTENNHKVTNNIYSKQVNGDATVAENGTAITKANVEIVDGRTLVVTLDDEVTRDENNTVLNRKDNTVKNLRGHWIKVTFTAKIKDGLKPEDLQKVTIDPNTEENRATPNVGNQPVDSSEKHDGVPNKASYTVAVSNGATMEDESNTVTVKPAIYPVYFSKNELGGEELEGASIVVKDENGNTIDEWTSEKEAHKLELKPGKYTMKEVVAPEGFQQVTTVIEFEVDIDGNVTLLTTEVDGGGKISVKGTNHLVLEDAPTKVLTVNKTWDDNDNALGYRSAEVEFVVLKNGKPTDMTITVTEADDWSGSIEVPGDGSEYTLKEVTRVKHTLPIVEVRGDITNVKNVTRPWIPETPDENEKYTSFELLKEVGKGVPSNRTYDVEVTIVNSKGEKTEYTVSLKPNEKHVFDYITVGSTVTVKEKTYTNYNATYYLDGKKTTTVEFKATEGMVNKVKVVNNLKPGIPETRDNTDAGFWFVGMMVSLIIAMNAIFIKKKCAE